MVFKINGKQGNPEVLRYRVVKDDETVITQADVDSIAIYVYEVESGETVIDAESLSVSDSIFDELQSWDKDSVGYNVKINVAGSYLPGGGKTYRVEVKVTPTVGEAFYLDHVEIRTIKTYSAS